MPIALGGLGLAALGAKVDDARETKQVRKGKMSRLPTFPWSMIPSERRLPLFRIMLFLFEHDPCRDWFPLFRIMLSVHASFMRSPLGSGPTRITGLNHVAGVEIGRVGHPLGFCDAGGGGGWGG